MTKSKFMFLSMIILSILSAVILVLSCIHMFINPDYDMSSWIMVGCLGIFAVVQIICILLEKFHLRKTGFYCLHIGLVLILLGCFMYFYKGESYQLIFPADNLYRKVEVPVSQEQPEALDLLMDIKISDTTIEYYSPTYSIYQIDIQSGAMTAIENGLEMQDGYLDLSAYGGKKMSQEELESSLSINPSTGAVYYYITGSTALIQNTTPSYYEVKFSLYSVVTEKYYGDTEPLTLTVNHPVRCEGWKIYLMGISSFRDTDAVTLIYKKDPGEYITLAGILLLIAGTFISCFSRPGKTNETPKEKTKLKKRKGDTK